MPARNEFQYYTLILDKQKILKTPHSLIYTSLSHETIYARTTCIYFLIKLDKRCAQWRHNNSKSTRKLCASISINDRLIAFDCYPVNTKTHCNGASSPFLVARSNCAIIEWDLYVHFRSVPIIYFCKAKGFLHRRS